MSRVVALMAISNRPAQSLRNAFLIMLRYAIRALVRAYALSLKIKEDTPRTQNVRFYQPQNRFLLHYASHVESTRTHERRSYEDDQT